MKNIKIITSVIILTFILAFQPENEPTSEELKTTCLVLAKLTDNAIVGNKRSDVVLYYNVFKVISEEHDLYDGCDTYFDEVRANYANDIGVWCMGLESAPYRFANSGGKGFTHREVNDFFGRLGKYDLTKDDFQDMLLFMDVKRGQVNVENIKNTDLEKWKAISDSMKKMKFDKIDNQKLNELPDAVYKIDEFKAKLKNGH